MKKLQKLTLKELGKATELMTLNEESIIKGGDCTWDEYQELERNGEWYGGVVEGYGYISQTVYASADGPNTSLMTVDQFLQTKYESYWDVVTNAAINAACDWNAVTAYFHDVASASDQTIATAQNNAFVDALRAIWASDIGINEKLSVTVHNNNVSIYDTSGNLIFVK